MIAVMVSVIMATRNGARFLNQAIESVLRQTFRDFEFLIVDDASTDETQAIVGKLGDTRIRLLKNRRPLGLTRSLNRALRQARGNYAARIDDDDVWVEPEKLERQVAFLEQHPGVGMCGAQHIVIDEQGKELYRLHVPLTDREIRQELLRRNVFAHSGVLLRKSALAQVGLYDEQLHYTQDYELWLRIGRRFQLRALPDASVKQRVNLSGVTSQKRLQQWGAQIQSAWKYRNAYPGFSANLPVYARELLMNIVPKRWFYAIRGIKARG